MIKRSGQNILKGAHPRTIESLVSRGLIFRIRCAGYPTWAFTAKGRGLMDSPELDWMAYQHGQAIQMRKDMINSRDVRVTNPTREGNGVSHRWTRILGGKRYSFTMVVMPTGELRYSVSRLDGNILPNGGTFACDWTIVKTMTFAAGTPLAPRLVQRPGRLGHFYKTRADNTTVCVSRDHRLLADACGCAFDAMWDITVSRHKAIDALDTIDQAQMVDVVIQAIDNGRDDLTWVADSIDARECQVPNGRGSTIPRVVGCPRCTDSASPCDECALTYVVELFAINGDVRLAKLPNVPEFDCV